MRNRIARLITIGLTTVSMTLTALSGAAPITLTAQAAPNDPAERAKDSTVEWVQPDYDKGTNEVTNHMLDPGVVNDGSTTKGKFQGAVINDPDYNHSTKWGEMGKNGYTVDPTPGRYTFAVMQPKYKIKTNREEDFTTTGVNLPEYIVFSVDTTSKKVYASIMKRSSLVNTYEIPANGKPGFQNFKYSSSRESYFEYLENTGIILQKEYLGLKESGAVGLWNNRFNVRNMYDGVYFTGIFNNGKESNGYYLESNGAYRIFSLDNTLSANHMQTVTEAIPTESKQTTTYWGVTYNEDGTQKDRKDWIKLDEYTINGFSGQSYHIPGPNTYLGWQLIKAPASEEMTGKLGNPYPKGYEFSDVLAGGYIRKWEVVDDNQTVTQRIYRDLEIKTNGSETIESIAARYTARYPDDPKDKQVIKEHGIFYICVNRVENIKLGKTPREKYSALDDYNGVYGSPRWGKPSYGQAYQVIGVRNPIPYAPKDVEYLYKLIPSRPYSPETKFTNEKADGSIKKALRLQNIAHEFTPSVPDMWFNYEIRYPYGNVVDGARYPIDLPESYKIETGNRMYEYDYEYQKVIISYEADGKTPIYKKDADGNDVWELSDRGIIHKYTPIARGVDVEGTKFDIWRGPVGGLEIYDVVNNTWGDNGTVRFHHDDNAQEDKAAAGTGDTVKDDDAKVITKKLPFRIKEGVFKAPGVYRYDLIETGMTEWDSEAEKGKPTSAVIDDIEEKQGEIRYLDVYVEWNEQEDGFVIKDMVLHNITEDLEYDIHGSYAISAKTPAKEGEAYGPSEEDKEGKKDSFSTSIYTTYDLVVGKEIMGKGLTNWDINDRIFTFKVTINAPSYTHIRGSRGPYEKDEDVKGVSIVNWNFDVPENGVLNETSKSWNKERNFAIKVRQGEWILISGIPSGSTYTVEEVDDWSADQDHPALFESYYSVNMKEVTEAESNRKNNPQYLKTGVSNDGSMLEDQPRRNTYMMMMQDKYQTVLNGKEFTMDDTKEPLVNELTDVSSVPEKKTGTITMEKKTEDDPVANVFFLNLRRDNVVTGVAMSVAPYALMVAAAVIGVGGFLIVKKRRDADLDED